MAAFYHHHHHHHHQPPSTDFTTTTTTNHFTVDDLLVDFPTDDDEIVINDAFFQTFTSNSTDNSSFSGNEPHFSANLAADLSVPYDELAELEWLSSFTEESFSSDDLHNLQLISAVTKTPATATSSSDSKTLGGSVSNSNRVNSPIFQTDVLVPGKVRSKRSRAAPCDWSSRLILLKSDETPPCAAEETDSSGVVRRCLHCGSDKTPQWRRGPMGPKTLCNACGVRYKSGRLVPEYRPAASPTFVPAKHSNSHRKVMELRRQMELRNSFLNSDGCNNNNGDDYLIHEQFGSSFMHMI
ncbi:hypothetical protein OSB04_004312 [Centaurea solstitialis]|uniref:GATA transcription factor n=1 Tax=Centaurea solstitialis TaxID=347529 RepID=A0AA38U6Z9_9ASTR|nr:hypothetical protein OSB04_004312 [Centaurea solstitialis]